MGMTGIGGTGTEEDIEKTASEAQVTNDILGKLPADLAGGLKGMLGRGGTLSTDFCKCIDKLIAFLAGLPVQIGAAVGGGVAGGGGGAAPGGRRPPGRRLPSGPSTAKPEDTVIHPETGKEMTRAEAIQEAQKGITTYERRAKEQVKNLSDAEGTLATSKKSFAAWKKRRDDYEKSLKELGPDKAKRTTGYGMTITGQDPKVARAEIEDQRKALQQGLDFSQAQRDDEAKQLAAEKKKMEEHRKWLADLKADRGTGRRTEADFRHGDPGWPGAGGPGGGKGADQYPMGHPKSGMRLSIGLPEGTTYEEWYAKYAASMAADDAAGLSAGGGMFGPGPANPRRASRNTRLPYGAKPLPAGRGGSGVGYTDMLKNMGIKDLGKNLKDLPKKTEDVKGAIEGQTVQLLGGLCGCIVGEMVGGGDLGFTGDSISGTLGDAIKGIITKIKEPLKKPQPRDFGPGYKDAEKKYFGDQLNPDGSVGPVDKAAADAKAPEKLKEATAAYEQSLRAAQSMVDKGFYSKEILSGESKIKMTPEEVDELNVLKQHSKGLGSFGTDPDPSIPRGYRGMTKEDKKRKEELLKKWNEEKAEIDKIPGFSGDYEKEYEKRADAFDALKRIEKKKAAMDKRAAASKGAKGPLGAMGPVGGMGGGMFNLAPEKVRKKPRKFQHKQLLEPKGLPYDELADRAFRYPEGWEKGGAEDEAAGIAEQKRKTEESLALRLGSS